MTPLRILFQDEYLVAIDKPPGMLVHPVEYSEDNSPSAMKILRDQLGQRVSPIHRLDRPTSGILLFGLDKKTNASAQQAFEKREVIKTYLAIVTGKTPNVWVSETALSKYPTDLPKAAKTTFELLATSPQLQFRKEPDLVLSLIMAKPKTGRFHQIRRHLVEDQHPIVGDFRYAGIERSMQLGEVLNTGTRMLLQSAVLEMKHPRTGEQLRIEAPVDEDFEKCFPNIASIATGLGLKRAEFRPYL